MVELTAQDVGEFQVLWKQHTGQDISPELAREYAERLIDQIAYVVEPLLKKKERPP